MTRALVIRAAGTNCDEEVCRGLAAAGAAVDLLHVDALIKDPRPLADARIIAFPGGFSYGDDVASGRIFAMKLREQLWDPLRAAAARGVPMIGICNGFQVLVQVGLLPGPDHSSDYSADRPTDRPMASTTWSELGRPVPSLALRENAGGRYVCRWVPVRYERGSVCLWTKGLADLDPVASQLPVGHGEGRLTPRSPEILARLESRGQIALRYEDNYNGSAGAVAGICDASGRIFGLMPHPDRFLDWTRHPTWTRIEESNRRAPTPGMMMFLNAVKSVG